MCTDGKTDRRQKKIKIIIHLFVFREISLGRLMNRRRRTLVRIEDNRRPHYIIFSVYEDFVYGKQPIESNFRNIVTGSPPPSFETSLEYSNVFFLQKPIELSVVQQAEYYSNVYILYIHICILAQNIIIYIYFYFFFDFPVRGG